MFINIYLYDCEVLSMEIKRIMFSVNSLKKLFKNRRSSYALKKTDSFIMKPQHIILKTAITSFKKNSFFKGKMRGNLNGL